jgi:hypothetical protein
MKWDFSLWQQAEDRWAELRAAAEEQRILRQIQKASRRPRLHVIRNDIARVVASHPGDRVRRWLKGAA